MSSESHKIQYEVFGIGSAQGADEVGWQVLDRLQQDAFYGDAFYGDAFYGDAFYSDAVRLHRLETPMDLLGIAAAVETHERATRVWVLIDACLGEHIGQVHCWRWPSVPDSAMRQPRVSSHGLGLLDALRLGQELELLPQVVWIYGIEIGSLCSIDSDLSHLREWKPCARLEAAIAACASQIASRSSRAR